MCKIKNFQISEQLRDLNQVIFLEDSKNSFKNEVKVDEIKFKKEMICSDLNNTLLIKKNFKIQKFQLKLINLLIKKGKKLKALKIFKKSILLLKLSFPNKDPNIILAKCFSSLQFFVKLVKIRKFGQTLEIPTPISLKKQFFLSIIFILKIVKSQKNTKIYLSLTEELINIYLKIGGSLTLKKEFLKKAYSNRFSAHYRWF